MPPRYTPEKSLGPITGPVKTGAPALGSRPLSPSYTWETLRLSGCIVGCSFEHWSSMGGVRGMRLPK